MKYVTLTRPRRTASDDYVWAEPRETMEVLVQPDDPIDTGLLNADGLRLYRVSMRGPIGFCREE